ncbi:hypothetical protein TSO221_12085 [Azospirillum sp. TSO22-1]|nr:hypothetical protein TSO221_12085 [Azospirillum sp. TSO22-1]
MVVRRRASFLAVLATVPALLCAAPARAGNADDAAALWDWVARTIAVVARCADHDAERREEHLDILEQYFDDVKDAQAKIEAVLAQEAARAGSRNPARDTARRMDEVLVRARAALDEQNQGHDIRFVKNVCKGLPTEYRAGKAQFAPLAERFPGESRAIGIAAR